MLSVFFLGFSIYTIFFGLIKATSVPSLIFDKNSEENNIANPFFEDFDNPRKRTRIEPTLDSGDYAGPHILNEVEEEPVDIAFLIEFSNLKTQFDWNNFKDIWQFEKVEKKLKALGQSLESDPKIISNLLKFKIFSMTSSLVNDSLILHAAAQQGSLKQFATIYKQNSIKTILSPEDIFELMLSSLAHKNFEVATFLLSQNFDINLVVDGNSLLSTLITESQPEKIIFPSKSERIYHSKAIKWLIYYGADIHTKIGYSKIPLLHLAVRSENNEALSILLEAGADVKVLDSLNDTAIEYAESLKNNAALDILLFHQMSFKIDLEILSSLFYSMILNFDPASETDFEAIQFFIRKGFKPVMPSGTRTMLLHFCAYKGFNELLEMFLEFGADPVEELYLSNNEILTTSTNSEYPKMLSDKIFRFYINYSDPAIAVAVAKGNLAAVSLFYKYGVDLNTKTGKQKLSLLNLAFKLKNVDVVNLLISLDALCTSCKLKEIDWFNSASIQYRIIKLSCGHFYLVSPYSKTLRLSGKSCNHCGEKIDVEHFAKTLISIKHIPFNLYLDLPGSVNDSFVNDSLKEIGLNNNESMLRNLISLELLNIYSNPMDLFQLAANELTADLFKIFFEYFIIQFYSQFDSESNTLLCLRISVIKLRHGEYSPLFEKLSLRLTDNSDKMFELILFSLMNYNFEAALYFISHKLEIFTSKERSLIATLIEKSNPKIFEKSIKRNNYTNAIAWLVDVGADVNWKAEGSSLSLLHSAILNENNLAFNILLKGGADLRAVDSQNRTAIMLAIEAYSNEAFENLIFNLPDYESINEEISKTFYNLILNYDPSSVNRFNAIRTIIRSSFTPSLSTKKPYFLLHYCTYKEYNDILEVLLDSKKLRTEKVYVEDSFLTFDSQKEMIRDDFFRAYLSYNDPPEFLAVAKGNVRAVKLFFERGVDSNLKSSKGSKTLLHFAIITENAEMTNLLLSYNGTCVSCPRRKVYWFNSICKTHQLVHLNCSHPLILSENLGILDISSASCSICGKAFNLKVIIEKIIYLENIPKGITLKLDIISNYLYSTKIWTEVHNSKIPLKKLRNYLNLGVFSNHLKMNAFLEFAAKYYNAERFEIVFDYFDETSKFLPASLYHFMKWSLLEGNLEVSENLLRKGFDLNWTSPKHESLLGILIEASLASNTELFGPIFTYNRSIDWMIKNGSNVNMKHTVLGMNLISLAVLKKMNFTVNLILESPRFNRNEIADENIAVSDSPIILAAKIGNVTSLKLFHAHGFDLFMNQARVKSSIVITAILHNRIEALKYLLSFENNSYKNIEIPFCALHRLAYENKHEMLKFLMNMKINLLEKCSQAFYEEVLVKNKEIGPVFGKDDPAIIVALAKNNVRVLKLFLDAGFDPNFIVPSASISLLDLAVKMGRGEMASLLILRGAVNNMGFESSEIEFPLNPCGRLGCLGSNSGVFHHQCGHLEHALCIHKEFECFNSPTSILGCNTCDELFNYSSFILNLFKTSVIPKGFTFFDYLIDEEAVPEISNYIFSKLMKKETFQNLLEAGFLLKFNNDKLIKFLCAATVCAEDDKYEYFVEAAFSAAKINKANILFCYYLSLVAGNFFVSEYFIRKWMHLENIKSSESHTPLSFIISNFRKFEIPNIDSVIGSEKAIKWLIERGADINEPAGLSNNAPLNWAVRFRNDEAVKLLVEAGADLDVINNEGFTPGTLAGAIGNQSALEIFYNHGVNLERTFSKYGANVVQIALLNNQKSTFRYLMSLGFKPVTRSGRLSYFLDFIAFHKYEILDYLLSIGADPFETCCSVSYQELIRADEELKENLQEDDFAILVPIIKNNTKTVEVFLNHGVPVNLRIRNLTSSLLHLACQLKLPEMAKFLISKGADIKMKDSQGKVALDYLNSEKIIGELLNYDNYDLEI